MTTTRRKDDNAGFHRVLGACLVFSSPCVRKDRFRSNVCPLCVVMDLDTALHHFDHDQQLPLDEPSRCQKLSCVDPHLRSRNSPSLLEQAEQIIHERTVVLAEKTISLQQSIKTPQGPLTLSIANNLPPGRRPQQSRGAVLTFSCSSAETCRL